MVKPVTEARKKAAETLAFEDLEAFDFLVVDFRDACELHERGALHPKDYEVLAQLVRAGWRKRLDQR